MFNSKIKYSFFSQVKYFISERIESYEKRKEANRIQKNQQKFIVEDKKLLLQNNLDMHYLVPNFFTDELKMKRFIKMQTPSTGFNFFTNSYASIELPLSKDMKLRQSFNRLNDGEVRVGRIFEIEDSIAGIVSYQHCFGQVQLKEKQNPFICVTGAIESFKLYSPILMDQDISIQGYMCYAGKTSMEIQVNVHQNGELKSSSLFTMIARYVDNPTKGYKVPSLSLENLSPKEYGKSVTRLEEAKNNIGRRKIQMANSYDKKPPNSAEMEELHQIFLSKKTHLRASEIPIGETIVSNHKVMHTQQRNIHGKIFGGYLIRQMVQIGWIVASKFSSEYAHIEDITNIYFKNPVDISMRLIIKAQVTYVQETRIVVTVEAYTSQFTSNEQKLCCYMHIIASSKKQNKKVFPDSYEESLLYLSSKRAFNQVFHI